MESNLSPVLRKRHMCLSIRWSQKFFYDYQEICRFYHLKCSHSRIDDLLLISYSIKHDLCTQWRSFVWPLTHPGGNDSRFTVYRWFECQILVKTLSFCLNSRICFFFFISANPNHYNAYFRLYSMFWLCLCVFGLTCLQVKRWVDMCRKIVGSSRRCAQWKLLMMRCDAMQINEKIVISK